jgi:hypothetical protein
MAANSGQKIHGKNGAIYVEGPKGTGTKVSVKTEYTINLGRDYVDATVFGDVNKTYLTGLKDISGTWAGLMDVSGDLLVNASDEDSKDMYLYADDRDGSEILLASGPGLFDASINASNSDAVRASGNFRAAGPWSVLSGA